MSIQKCGVVLLLGILLPAGAGAQSKGLPEIGPIAWGALQASERAEELVTAGKPAEAVAVLAQEVDRTGYFMGADALWRLHLRLDQPAEARRLTARLLAREDPMGLAAGHALAGREAFMDGDLAAAERHYRAYLAGPFAEEEVAAELLAIAAPGEEDGERRAALARDLCTNTKLPAPLPDQCVSTLLHLAGDARGALAAVSRSAEHRPNEVGTLTILADRAEAAGDWATAEQARRRILAIDPGTPLIWLGLARLYAVQDEQAKLVALVEEMRGLLGRVSADVYLVLADELLERRQNRQAIDVLRRAREELAPGEEAGWINDKLRTAYAAFGREHS